MLKLVKRIKNRLSLELQKYRYNSLRNKVIIVHTLGKVGSSTIYYELKKRNPFNNVFHTHFLSNEWLKNRLKNGNHFASNHRAAQKVFSHLKTNPKSKKYIITLVREPVSRELSNFMQNPNDFLDNDVLTYSTEELKTKYLEKLNYNYTLEWFDTEFANYTEFDVYSKPYDKNKGYSIYQHNDFKILVIKLEKLNDCFEKAMKTFLGIELKLKTNYNQSSSKEISGIYSELKKTIRFTEEELNKVYTHKYVTHFYNKDEINSFKVKWLKPKDK